MTIIHSSDLGWTAGQDISQEFAALAKTFKAGDTFVFDHMYEISGSKIQLPDNFTLAGGAPGAGIDVVDTPTNSTPLFFLGNGNTLVDLTVTHSNSPPLVTTVPDILKVKVGTDYDSKRTFVADDKDDVSVINSHFEGNVSIFLDIVQGENLLIQDTEFAGGYYQVRFGADVTSPVIDNSLFRNSLGDGIKTGPGSNAESTTNATVSNSVFLNNFRDGIDTTGGFKDSIVTDSYFVGNGMSGLDIKTGYNTNGDFAAGEPMNENILIINSEFVDIPSAVVVTTLDRGSFLTNDNAKQWASQNIRIEDSIIENTNPSGGNSKMFLVKDSYDIHWDDVTLLGNVVEKVEKSDYDFGLPQDVSGTGVTTGESRGTQPDSYYQNLAGPDWSNISYPTDGAPTPVDSVVDPDPISYTPPQATEQTNDAAPVVEAPVPSNDAPIAESDVANTDHNKTILVDVLGNDSDPDGDTLTLTKVSYSGNTSIVSIENGKIKVNPLSAAKEDRVETIQYTVSDGKGGTDTAELKVNISGLGEVSASQPDAEPSASVPPADQPEPVVEAPVEAEPVLEAPVPSNDAPIAESDVANTDHNKTILVDVLGNDSDPDGDTLTLTKVSYSGNTSIVSIENGKIKINPLSAAKEDRVETIQYTVSDGKGGTDTAELKVNISGLGEVSASGPIVAGWVETAPGVDDPVEPDPVVEMPVEVIAPETDLAPDVTSQGAYSRLLDVQLVDTGTDKVLGDLFEGSKLSSRDFSSGNITLSAEAINSGGVNIGSVKLELDGQYSRVENVAPYALFGDDSKGNFFGGEQLADGTHFATLTVYSGKNGNGSVLEQFTVNFEVGNYESLIIDGSPSSISSYSAIQDTGTATVSEDQSAVELEGSAWKSLNLFGSITEQTVLEFDFKSDVEGEIQGIGFVNEEGDLEPAFFQLAGSQNLGIQDFNGTYEAGSGFGSYTIPIGQYFTGSVEQLVLVSDDDVGLGAMTTFDNINLIEALA